mmetsp:Transcript_32442/g.50527  ORF Transcript_32442/g.50527 Transcript_32442/m.50527 type:complete len:223 (+) Transcript_32442:225-893(+)
MKTTNTEIGTRRKRSETRFKNKGEPTNGEVLEFVTNEDDRENLMINPDTPPTDTQKKKRQRVRNGALIKYFKYKVKEQEEQTMMLRLFTPPVTVNRRLGDTAAKRPQTELQKQVRKMVQQQQLWRLKPESSPQLFFCQSKIAQIEGDVRASCVSSEYEAHKLALQCVQTLGLDGITILGIKGWAASVTRSFHKSSEFNRSQRIVNQLVIFRYQGGFSKRDML